MQNKGLVKLFAFLFGVVSIYQLSFTFMNNKIESEAKQYVTEKISSDVEGYDRLRSDAQVKYLDSIGNQDVFIGNTFNDVKEKAMNLGLDLKGGINVILQISVKDILSTLAKDSEDPKFLKALADAEELQKDGENPYVEDFFIAFDAIDSDTKLSSPDIFAHRDFTDEIDIRTSEDKIKGIIRTKVDESIVSAFEVLRKRIDQFGVTQPNIQRIGKSARILVELPGAKDVNRVKKLLQGTAQLEFWDVTNGQNLGSFLNNAHIAVKDLVNPKAEQEVTETEDEGTSEDDSQDSLIDDLVGGASVDSTSVDNDLARSVFFAPSDQAAIFSINKKDADVVKEFLNSKEGKALLPSDARYTKFAFSKEEKENEFLQVYALASSVGRGDKPELSGAVVTDARQVFDEGNRPAVSMDMNLQGARTWEKMTGRAFNEQTQIAIVLDDIVYSAPGVTTGAISGGSSRITGNYSLLEAQDLANVLRAGKLPASADIIQADEVGPSLGQEAIDTGKMSFGIALALVLIWMLFYYGKAGIFSDIALLFNILLIFGILSGLGAVLTLPGIAGIVLTVGIAVDANVLIYERIREELAKGKGQKEAIKDGFSNALSSILDANITTGLTALILFSFGTGPIKGFATTLLIGIATSLFTAIFITRLLIDWYVNRGGKLDFSTSLTKGLFRNINLDWLKKRKMAYIFSAILIVAGLSSLFTTGLDEGIDFVGGRTYQVRFAQDVNPEEVKDAVNAVFESSEVKTIGSANQLKISTKFMIDENTAEADEEVQVKLFESIKPFLPDGYEYQQFIDADNDVGKMYSGKVSPTIADDIKRSSVWAVLGSLLVVFLYILLRFKKWQFSLGAVMAVFHDVLIVLGIFSITWKFMPFSMEIDQAFIAAILTVIGYSLNDTVVVFDRIREFLNEHTGWEFDKTVNSALNSTISRTLNTSLTTLVVLLAMFIFGADSLRGLLFALIVGVVVGTYSSVFIATPIMYDTVNKLDKKKKD